jgi:hypothetical protein
MKRKLLFVLLLFSGMLTAQNYRTVIPSSEQWFLDNSSSPYYEAIKPDSVVANGNDTLIWHYPIVRPDYNLNVFDTLAPSWIGRYTLFASNGDEVFFNSAFDSIILRPRNAINVSWTSYRFPNGDHYDATITSRSWYTSSLFNDSAENISLQLYDASNQPIAGSFNGISFVISRNNGLITAPDIYSFPSGQYLYNRIDAHRLTNAAVFNYYTGDQFQYQYDEPSASHPPSLTFRTVLNRQDWSPDSVRFTYYDEYYDFTVVNFQIDTTYSSATTYYTARNMNSLVYNCYPQQQVTLPSRTLSYYSMRPYIAGTCSAISEAFNVWGYSQFDSTCSCYRLPFEQQEYMYTWMDGHGYVVADYDIPHNQYWSENLIYYRLSNDSCGNRLTTGMENGNLIENEVTLFPNPSSGSCEITSAQPITEIEILNGELQREARFIPNKGSTGLRIATDLSPGIYFLRVQSENGSTVKKLIIQ